MKIRITLAAAALLICSVSYADIVSENAARNFANMYFNGKGAGTKAGYNPMTLVYTSQQGDFSSIDPEFYVFNRDGGGYVIISGESGYHPVLGYSDTDSFDPENLPDGLVWLLDILTSDIGRVRQSGEPASATVAREWASVGAYTKASSSKTLETADWNQYDPFNNMCPEVGGQRCLTGCVATATAILMHYHALNTTGAPTAPVDGAVLPRYEWKKQKKYIEGFSLEGHSYDFKNMPKTESGCKNASTEIKANIAQLFYDLGVALEMDYGTGGSSASMSDVILALGTYFGYSKNNRVYLRDSYTETEWFNMIKESIDKGNPVMYDGINPSSGGGHCFLIDGYQNDNGALMYRFNFGWGGSQHGTFLRIGNSYDYNQGAIFNIIPETGSSSFPDPVLAYYALSSKDTENYGGMYMSDNYICSGYVHSLAPTDAENIYFRLLKGNSPISTSDRPTTLNKGYIYYIYLNCNGTTGSLGETLRIEYSYDGKRTWLPMDQPNDGSAVIEYPLVPMFVFDGLPANPSRNTKYELKLKNGDVPWAFKTTWKCTTVSGTTNATINQGNSGNHWFITFSSAGTYDVTGTVTDYSGKFYDSVTARVVVK